ncbi:MAG: diguanylate cyclase [Candidatus Nanopelagicales bacterium]
MGDRHDDDLLQQLPTPVLVLDPLGRIQRANDAAVRLLGGIAAGTALASLVDIPDQQRAEAWLASILDGEPGRSVFLGPLDVVWNGAERAIDLTGTTLPGDSERVVVVLRDLTPVYSELMSMVRAISIDQLTGLFNRTALMRELKARQEQGGGVLLYLDLDRFKAINDSHSHEVGDRVLAEIARRLTASLGDTGVAGRIGGDEFLVLLAGVPLSVGRERARGLAAELAAPMDIVGLSLTVTVSFGVSELLPGMSIDAAISAADTAMYVAKRDGKGNVVSFDEGLRTLAERRASLIEENKALRSAAVKYSVEARTDAGTGLPNLRRLLEDLALVHDRARRSRTPYCLLFLDLDHFGSLNKRYGDAVGDQTLVAVAETLTQVMREGEIVYRKGGEELVVVLWDTVLDGGVAAAHRYREALVDAALAHGGHPQTPVVTASFGVAEGPGDGDAADVLRTASLCMLSAKKFGRNRVSIDPLPVPDHPRTA